MVYSSFGNSIEEKPARAQVGARPELLPNCS